MAISSTIRTSVNLCVVQSVASLALLIAADGTTPGTVTAPNPTTCGISLVWPFSGDADGDGRVTLRYRSIGGTWKTGMPLFRIPAGTTQDVTWGNRHLGSLFDLQPATSYDIELTLNDPDGGSTVRSLTVTTRSVPVAMVGAPVKAVTPANFAARLAAAVSGDILELAAGTYPGFTLAVDGQATRPIVIRSSAGAIIDGMIEMGGRQYVQLQGLTVNGRIRINSTRGVAVTRCTINARTDRGGGYGIVSFLRSEDTYIADNTVIGTTVWAESSLGVSGDNLGEGICVTGPGCVIRNNRVRGFRDGISLMEFAEAVDQYAIDIVENDVSECADDGIEVDSSAGNCRVLRNRLTNCFMGISSQPGLGGPLYLVRNVLYNIAFEAFKLHNGTYGDVLLHNTVVKSGDAFSVASGATIARTWTRNNLFIGGPGSTWNGYDSGTGRVMNLTDLEVAGASLDYDGFGSTAGFFSGKFGPSVTFSSVTQLRSATTEVHAVQVGLSAFASTITYPSAAMTAFAPPDLRLAAASPAVDAGVVIPGINDGFIGSAPDLGAYEVGQALPIYGLRSPGEIDSTPPVISGVVLSAITTSGATISWTTDEGADTQLEYGLTTAYGTTTVLDSHLITAHSMVLTGLTANTTYHVRARSRDAAGNLATSADQVLVVPTVSTPGVTTGGTTRGKTASTAGSTTGSDTSDNGGGGGGCGLGGLAVIMLSGFALLRYRHHS